MCRTGWGLASRMLSRKHAGADTPPSKETWPFLTSMVIYWPKFQLHCLE